MQDYICCDPDIVEQGIKAIHKQGTKKIWIVYDMPDFSPMMDIIKKLNGQILKQHEFHRGVVVLYEIQ